MKLVRAMINTQTLDELRDKLFGLGAPGMTVSNVMGIGKPLGQMRYVEDRGFVPRFYARTQVDVYIEDERVDEIVDTINEVCRTGQIGDGKIFILPVDEVVRIRTNERGSSALY